ncbi:MAG: hypothetical protein H5U40_11010, partial [Polyangiaceae bacterium]|nr:hypothetical protein [Polyangiaceae bacterium]
LEIASRLDLASIGIGPSGLAAFVDSAGVLALLELTDEGTAAGVPVPVRSGEDFTGAFDLAAGANGGLVVVGVDGGAGESALAVRMLDASGALSDLETPIDLDLSAVDLDPSAVALDGGFAVAFRRSSASGTTVRVVFLDASGDAIGAQDVAIAQSAGGGLRLASARDGTLLVVFDDVNALRAVRLECAGD